MRDLTGAPGYEYIIAEHEDIFDIIKNGDENDFVMATGCGKEDSDKAALKELGLVTEHSYGIISAATVTDSAGNECNICKLRNPWGNFEWSGDWGDESDKWTEEAKTQLNVTTENDGTFWMDIQDMKKYFDRVQLCKIYDDFTYTYSKCEGVSAAVFKVEIPTAGKYTFSVSQRGERMFPKNSGYEYSDARCFLVKINAKDADTKVTYIKGKKAMKTRDCFLEIEELEEGSYYFVGEVDWIESTESQNFTVTSYGAGGAIWEAIEDIDKNQVIRYAAESIVAKGEGVEMEPNAEDPLIVKHTVTSDFGYQIICIKNGAEQSGYKETVTYNNFEGLTFMEPESGMQYDVLVKAGSTKIILIKQSCRGFSSGYSYSSSV